ncbi:hypothetical protein GT755_36800 [Herbidospora sp. NEAU-GS84]|uniref:Phosphotransacetylase n=1 Tax=Herbidospora solisilvae TaxID=2696284 RepID=A0A7C9NJU5_9ACTN|nr:DUF6758 family protein [Herbidospora solisilvae]NAS27215.1 hypothetical protein [Herbidospora solisilvae]
MRAAPTCPRCFGPLSEPNIWSSAWRCTVHGEVLPHRSHRPGPAAVELIRGSAVPAWVPWPLPAGWLVTGFAEAGDRAAVVAVSGPSLSFGPADVLIISEEPGVGLGSAYAGLPGPDPGDVVTGVPLTKIEVNGHSIPLWVVTDGVPGDRAVYVGEAAGCWLWTVAWPGEAGNLIALMQLALADLRDLEWDVPFGAFSPRLTGEGAAGTG